MKKLVAAMLCLALSLMCAVGLANEKIDPSELQIGVIMIGDTSDMGFNYSHLVGLQEMQKNLGIEDHQITILENVADDSTCADAISELISNGCNVIIGNSFGFQTYMYEAAAQHPEVLFCHYSGLLQNDTNFCRFNARNYQTRYLAGHRRRHAQRKRQDRLCGRVQKRRSKRFSERLCPGRAERKSRCDGLCEVHQQLV